MRVTILGVPLDAVTRSAALERVRAMLAEPRFHLVATPNPEFLVAAQRDPDFLRLLQQTDLNLPDGHGLLLVARWFGSRLPERVTGSDFTVDLCGLCAELGQSVFFLGGELPRVAERSASAMKRRFPDLEVAGVHEGGRVIKDEQGRLRCDAAAIEAIRASHAAVVLVAFGHGRQEKWCRDNLPDLPEVRLAMGIGGTFDFLAGEIKRAPLAFRRLHLEWLWRLIQEPRRWRRIWTAVVVFPYLAARERCAKMKSSST
jgi:N-acetylglucosaminyldiphosphoundecaprenol N-acetyl-beta-D-mannosaminyltransferase